MLKIRWSCDHLTFNMRISIPDKDSLYIIQLGVFLAATKQLCEWYFLFVCLSVCLSVFPSVCLSVCHTFLTMFPIVSSWNFQEFSPGTRVTSMQKVKVRGQRSRSQRSQLSRFRTVTPVWIHICWWNDIYSLMLLGGGALLFFKVIRQSSRSHGAKNRGIWPRLGVSGL